MFVFADSKDFCLLPFKATKSLFPLRDGEDAVGASPMLMQSVCLSELAGPEKKRLLDLASGMDKIIILLLFETGLEIDHLIDLRVSDLDIECGQLQISADKRVQLSSSALSEIKVFLSSRPGQVYLLEGRCGKPVTGKWKRCVLEKLNTCPFLIAI
jgi:hypothetical protein